MVNAIYAAFRPGVTVRMTGSPAALRHLRAEYRPVLIDDAAERPSLAVRFVDGVRRAPAGAFRGRYKTVAWAATIDDIDPVAMRATIGVAGAPRSFVLSLVQGYFLEALLSVVAAARGWVLLPGSGLRLDDGITLLLGRSRSGKSTLTAAALASGRGVLGDDQVFAAGDGTAAGFPRRLRFYSDLRETVPEAYERLPVASRAALVTRAAASVATKGFVAPPIRVPASVLGASIDLAGGPVSRVVVIERAPDVDDVTCDPLATDAIVELAGSITADQRRHVERGGPAGWDGVVAETRRREEVVLRAGFTGPALERLSVPIGWPAPRAVSRLAAELDIRRAVLQGHT